MKMNSKIDGNDNYGKPRQLYVDRITTMDEATFLKECETAIWLSAFAGNNPRSDYHWHVDACYSEAARRGKPGLYTIAYKNASAGAR
jgi:hypothetical protein